MYICDFMLHNMCVCVCVSAGECQEATSCCHSSEQPTQNAPTPVWQNIQINCCQAAETPSAAIFIWHVEDPDMQSWQVTPEHLWETSDKNQDTPDPRHNNTYHYLILLLFFKRELKMER